MRTAIAVLLALGAASLYGLGNALEHRVVTETGSEGPVEAGLLRRLVRRPLWVLGMVGDVGAYGLQAAALAFGALLLVQPLLVCGLLVALPLNARWTGRSIGRREWVAAIVLCVGLATFVVEAAPGGGAATAPVASWLRVGGTVGLLIVAALVGGAIAGGPTRAMLLGFAAGAMFGITAALTKTFVEQIGHGIPYTASHWEVYALAVLSITGILFTQHGFQAASLSASLPALEATEPVVAALVGVVLLHEHLDGRTAFDNLLIAVSIVAALVCVVFLAAMAGRDAAPPVAAASDPVEDACPRRELSTSRRESGAQGVPPARPLEPVRPRARPRRRRQPHTEPVTARDDAR